MDKLPEKVEFAGAIQLPKDVQLASNSDEPKEITIRCCDESIVDRHFGLIKLSHKEEDVDLSKFNNGALFIRDHDVSKIENSLGVITKSWIEDSALFVNVRLSEREEIKGIIKDITDGILTSVSVGTSIVELISEDEVGDQIVYTLKHQPYEISSVCNPAIATAKVILKEEVKDIPTDSTLTESTQLNKTGELKMSVETKVAAPVAPAVELASVELTRVQDIVKLAAEHGVDALEAISSGKTVGQFAQSVLASKETVGFKATPVGKDVGLSEKEVGQFSLLKAITCAASSDWSTAGFEREAIEAQAGLEGKTLLSNEMIIPNDVNFASTAAANPSLMATEKVRFIESIWDETIVNRLGATRMSDVVGELQIDRETSNGNAYWVAENVNLSENDYTTDSFTLSEKTVGATYNLSRSLLRQSSVNVEQRVYAHLRKAVALEMDKAILFGNGVDKPQGLVNLVDAANIVDMSVSGWTWAKIVEFYDNLSDANLASGNMKWAMNNASISTLQQTLIDPANTNSAFLMRSASDTLNSYEVLSSNIVPATDAVFGDFSKLLVADFGAPTISVDPYSNHKNGAINIRIFADIDSNIENTHAFSMYKV